jgi:hypothetical protein
MFDLTVLSDSQALASKWAMDVLFHCVPNTQPRFAAPEWSRANIP